MSETTAVGVWSISHRPASYMPTFKAFGSTRKGHSSAECWIAVSPGAILRFSSEEAAVEFASSDRAKMYNPGPKPLIDDHTEEARDIALDRLRKGRLSGAARAGLGKAHRECRTNGSYERGLGAGAAMLIGIPADEVSRVTAMTEVTTTKQSREAWANALEGFEASEDRDYRIGFLFAGLVLAGANREYRYR